MNSKPLRSDHISTTNLSAGNSLKALSKPRLISLMQGAQRIGYLQLDPTGAPMKIGPVSSPEFKLIQTLFNPSNATQIKFMPVAQTHERVYASVMGVQYTYVTNRIHDGMRARINELLKKITKSEAGKYVSFTQTARSIMLSITQSAGPAPA